ncbi:DNA-deoxyinosine glycosylase [Flavobacterium turcicum]|uniref:DNA-deoxyinosine glycosylase n=1 Tax=Flavobacterium turcicum TaxID=2764718 RepID=A0ABR7JF21_9FLAO|nr:DNA-deoxyinosine glycosylase [Flavobacterium turcicum]MBC5863098.1 DNA-deoxyinosine glycosylase [Flavobacterium turcicum]NHL01829.1 DNA-deoxyinosine glycosylase [Flavobacterium turcicum]
MIHSFSPIVNSTTKLLILGSIPGNISLQQQEYYGNARNQFWKIMQEILAQSDILPDYQSKIQLLQNHHIGLWDVLAACEREGSLDLNIKNPVVNDFVSFLKQYSNITRILFNGKASYLLFFKKFGQIKGITYHVMPSTSPANSMSFDNKLKIWSTGF